MKVFNQFDISEVKVEDVALKKYINIEPRMVLKSHGRHTEKFGKEKVNILERFIGSIGVPGHRGKKHKIQTGWASGKYSKNAGIMIEVLNIIQKRSGQNPIQIVVKAVENSAPCDEVTTIEYGGARYPQAVDVSPSRRITLAIRNLVHGGYDKAFNKKSSIAEGLATEILGAANKTGDSFAAQKKIETERQADGAR